MITCFLFKIESPNLGQKCILLQLRSLFIWAWKTFSFNFIFARKTICLSYLRCFVSHLVRPTVINVRPSLATDRIGLLSWPVDWTKKISINHRWAFRSIIDNAIDLFISGDLHFLWTTTKPLYVYNPDHIWDRACSCGCYNNNIIQ